MSEPTVEPRAVLPPFNWRVPVLGDVPNVPSDLVNLGTDIAATLSLDTGWRDISTSLINGWVVNGGNPPLVRRVGKSVSLKIQEIISPGTYSGLAFSAPPAGFGIGISANASANTAYGTLINRTTGALITGNYSLLSATTWFEIRGAVLTAGTIVRCWIQYLTNDPWPQTLPGTPYP